MRIPFIALLVLFVDCGLSAGRADDIKDCVKARGDVSIRACFRAINSGKWRGRDLAWAYSNRGVVYSDRQQYDLAIADYDKAIELDPKFSKAYNNRGDAYWKMEKYDRAIVDYHKARKLEPSKEASEKGRKKPVRKKAVRKKLVRKRAVRKRSVRRKPVRIKPLRLKPARNNFVENKDGKKKALGLISENGSWWRWR